MAQLSPVFLVMILSGVLGGLINHILSTQGSENKLSCWKHVIVGIGASLIIPLFLNSISANLIEQIIGGDGKQAHAEKLLVLIGFCLLAATVSRSFLESMSAKVLKLVENANSKAEKAEQQSDFNEKVLTAKGL